MHTSEKGVKMNANATLRDNMLSLKDQYKRLYGKNPQGQYARKSAWIKMKIEEKKKDLQKNLIGANVNWNSLDTEPAPSEGERDYEPRVISRGKHITNISAPVKRSGRKRKRRNGSSFQTSASNFSAYDLSEDESTCTEAADKDMGMSFSLSALFIVV